MRLTRWLNVFLTLAIALGTLPQVSGQDKPQTRQRPAATAKEDAAAQEKAAAAKEPSQPAALLKAGTKLKAELESTVDTRTAKPGDEVVARVTHNLKQEGQTVVKKGDRLLGRITEVKADGAAESGASLSVVFDRLVQGEATSQLNTVLSAVLSTPAEERARREERMREEPAMPAASPRPASARPAPSGTAPASGGLGSTVASTVDAAGSAASGVASATGNVATAADATLGGVGSTIDATANTALDSAAGASLATPVRAIRIDSEVQGESQTGLSSVLSTRQGHLRLESGTRLQFRAAAQSDAQAEKQ